MFGWIPGPGGIPLFILGLSLLAVNHDWAERWLETAKHKGVTFKKWLFPDKQWVRHTYDVVSVALVSGAIYMLFQTETRWLEGITVAVIVFGLFVFLLNRDRFDKFSNIFKRKR